MVEWPDDDDDDNGDDDFFMRRRALSLLECGQLLAAGRTSAKFSKTSSGAFVRARNDIMLMLDTQVRSDTKGCGPAPTSSHSKDLPTTPTVPRIRQRISAHSLCIELVNCGTSKTVRKMK